MRISPDLPLRSPALDARVRARRPSSRVARLAGVSVCHGWLSRRHPSNCLSETQMATTAPVKSAWASDRQERFRGHGSIYHQQYAAPAKPSPKQRPVLCANNNVEVNERLARQLEEHIAKGEAALQDMRCLLHRLRRPTLPPTLPTFTTHEAMTGGDTVLSILAHVPALGLGAAAQVCSAWYDASQMARDHWHGPKLAVLALRPLMAAMPSLCEVMRVSAVCTLWRRVACEERDEWCRAVKFEARMRMEAGCDDMDSPSVPNELSAVPFVDKVLRIADRIGFEVVSSGGLLASVQRAYELLRIPLSHEDRRALARLPELSLIARPEVPGHPAADTDVFVIAGMERIAPRVRSLADILAFGLMLVGGADEENTPRDLMQGVAEENARAILDIVSHTA